MSSPQSLRELAAKCEKPNLDVFGLFSLDAEIADAVDGWLPAVSNGRGMKTQDSPLYTTSLDAALGLWPRCAPLKVNLIAGPSQPLSICAAALRARAALAEKSP